MSINLSNPRTRLKMSPTDAHVSKFKTKKMAREVVKTVTTHQRKLTQTRRPWSDTKTENFLKLIERNGTR